MRGKGTQETVFMGAELTVQSSYSHLRPGAHTMLGFSNNKPKSVSTHLAKRWRGIGCNNKVTGITGTPHLTLSHIPKTRCSSELV